MQLKHLGSALWKYKFSVCCLCSAAVLNSNPLCRYCHQILKAEIVSSPSRPIQIENIKVYSLLHWSEASSTLVAQLIYHLKGGGSSALVNHLTRLFCLKHSILEKSNDCLFVPAPPKAENRQKDHAQEWASSLTRALPIGFYFSPLLRERSRSQKQLNQSERRALRLSYRRQRVLRWSRLLKSHTVVFCDDIVTTGSTAQSAYKTLGKPSNFEVWCLAYRKKRDESP